MLGSDGQTACGPVEVACALLPAIAPSAGPGPEPSEAKCRSASGSTAWTAGLACRCVTSAAETVADMASMIEKLRTFLACSCVSSARTPAWAAWAAVTRARMLDRVAGSRPSWFLKMMMVRLLASADRRLTCAALSRDRFPWNDDALVRVRAMGRQRDAGGGQRNQHGDRQQCDQPEPRARAHTSIPSLEKRMRQQFTWAALPARIHCPGSL